MPNLREEKRLWKKGYRNVAGLDESGRGPLAGPVVAGAVALNFKFKNLSLHILPSEMKEREQKSKPQLKIQNLRDSKKLNQEEREWFYRILTNHPDIWWGVGRVSEKLIDKINIKNSAELAMEKALLNLEKKMEKKANFLIIDGNHLNNSKLKTKKHKLVVKGDEKVLSCAIASIIAKVWRDRIMQKYHQKYPKYGFNKHKGYPTKTHIKMLQRYGKCVIHRDTFKYGRSKTKTYKVKKK